MHWPWLRSSEPAGDRTLRPRNDRPIAPLPCEHKYEAVMFSSLEPKRNGYTFMASTERMYSMCSTPPVPHSPSGRIPTGLDPIENTDRVQKGTQLYKWKNAIPWRGVMHSARHMAPTPCLGRDAHRWAAAPNARGERKLVAIGACSTTCGATPPVRSDARGASPAHSRSTLGIWVNIKEANDKVLNTPSSVRGAARVLWQVRPQSTLRY